jgi:lipid-A-disaccharide synthase
MPRIGIVAGEVSGDQLATDLVLSLRRQVPDLEVVGIGGPGLARAGCHILYPMEKLSVMGISEVFSRIIELLKIRRQTRDYFLENPPDVFIGVDAPDFNFRLERQLKKAGIKTIHYVSPSIWAWREYRLKFIANCIDKMLTLYPFEPPYYEKYNIPAAFVGHPLASKIPMETDKLAARKRLMLPVDKRIIAFLPGSRQSEIKRILPSFLDSLSWCLQEDNALEFITNLTSDWADQYVRKQVKQRYPALSIKYFREQSLDVIEASDFVLLASGTAALEAMLLKRPMVVAYRVNWLTYQIARRMIRLPYVSLPNVIAGKPVVPELLQHDCIAEKIGPEIMNWLNDQARVESQVKIFEKLHSNIRVESSHVLTEEILGVMNA